jgi:hypothetical protein
LTNKAAGLINQNIDLTKRSEMLIAAVESLSKQNKDLIEAVKKRADFAAEENLTSGVLAFDKEFQDADRITIRYGGNSSRINPIALRNGFKAFKIGNYEPVSISIINKRLTISTKVYDLDRNLIAEVEDNSWTKYTNFAAKINYDSKGFEVIDNKGLVVLSI